MFALAGGAWPPTLIPASNQNPRVRAFVAIATVLAAATLSGCKNDNAAELERIRQNNENARYESMLQNQRSIELAKEQRILKSQKYQAELQAETQRLKDEAEAAASIKKAEVDAETTKDRNALVAGWAELTAKLLLIVGGIASVIIGVFYFVTRTVRHYHSRVSETRIHEETERRKVAIVTEQHATERFKVVAMQIVSPDNGLSETERAKAIRMLIEASGNSNLLAPPV